MNYLVAQESNKTCALIEFKESVPAITSVSRIASHTVILKVLTVGALFGAVPLCLDVAGTDVLHSRAICHAFPHLKLTVLGFGTTLGFGH